MEATQIKILICQIQKNETDESLRKRMIEMENILSKNSVKTGFILTIDGYGSDSRELWEIPEVQTLTKRIVKMGLISLLDVSTTWRRNEDPIYCMTFGALEMWAISKGFLKSKYTLSKEQYKMFYTALGDANIACAKITGWNGK